MNKIVMVFMIALASVTYSYAGQIEECKQEGPKSIGCDTDWLTLLYIDENGHKWYAKKCRYSAICPSSYEKAFFEDYPDRQKKNKSLKVWHCFNENVGEHVFFTGKKRQSCPSPAELKPTRAEIDAWSKELQEEIERDKAEIAERKEKREKEREIQRQKVLEEKEKEKEEYRIKYDNPKNEYFKKYGYTFVDARDGRKYRAVKIGQQDWMAENLKYETPASYCWTEDSENCDTVGRFYSVSEIENVCPSGWHLPSDDDFKQLYDYALSDCINDGFLNDFSGNSRRCAEERLFARGVYDHCGSYGCDFFAFSAQRKQNFQSVLFDVKNKEEKRQGDLNFWCRSKDYYCISMIELGREHHGNIIKVIDNDRFGYPLTIRCIRNVGTTGLQTRGENSDNNSVENEPQQSSDICAKLVNEAKKIYEKCTSLQKGTPERSECVKLYNSRKQLAQKKCRIGGEN